MSDGKVPLIRSEVLRRRLSTARRETRGFRPLLIGALTMGSLCAACASADELPSEPVRPSLTETGGAAVTGNGGTVGNGGAASDTGGSSTNSGGFVGTGGVFGGTGGTSSGTGGAVMGTGGSVASGGSNGTGGSAGTGGASAGTGGAAPFDAGPSGTVLFTDDFESGSAKWVTPLPGWSIVMDGSNVFEETTAENTLHVASAGNVAWTDQVVEAKVKVLSFNGSSTSYLAGVYARFKDLNNHYYAALQSDGQFKIKKKSGGSNSSISSGAKGITIAVNTWYTVKLSVVGSTLTATVNGTQYVTATDTDIAAGGVALGTVNATAEFDDVTVTAP